MSLVWTIPFLPIVCASNLPYVKVSRNFTTVCQDGLVLPAWLPKHELDRDTKIFRGCVYLFALFYVFLGVSIVSDKFMNAIEKITSSQRVVFVPKKGGGKTKVVTQIWNETVANLTLMALGSSCPEIMLSVIEVYAKDFQAGDLGPGTIVGSAAYNLFAIVALCVIVIPKGQVRKIKKLAVYFTTASWSIFAYIWLYYIIAVSSVGEVEVWEAVLTFMFFPMTVLSAYVMDRCTEKGLARQDEEGKGQEILGETLEEAKANFAELLKELRTKNPKSTFKELEGLAEDIIGDSGPKSQAYYRRMVVGNVLGRSDKSHKTHPDLSQVKVTYSAAFGTYFVFERPVYTVLENIGVFEVFVKLEGAGLKEYVTMEYYTEDGSAKEGTDYIKASGVLVFKPGDTMKGIPIQIINDVAFEKDEYFYISLTNVTAHSPDNKFIKLGKLSTAEIVIIDDDHAGIFMFEEEIIDVTEREGVYDLPVVRCGGTRGDIRIPYWTIEGTAEAGIDFIESSGYVCFADEETRKTIPIGIVPEHSYERNVAMYVELGEPEEAMESDVTDSTNRSYGQIAANAVHSFLYGSYTDVALNHTIVPNNINHKREEDLTTEEKVAMEGRPRLGAISRVQINIRESDEFKNTVDKLVEKRGASAMSVGNSSWGDQFTEAIRVNPDGGEGEEDGASDPPGCGGYVLHFLTLFWKVLFAFVPPAEMCSGYLCFVMSIFWIGVLTAVIGDLASHFGCTVGLQDAVTAITFVALGTSVPDTFASKVAAIQDSTADNSVGNVTGSNAVNVFLGIGVAWSIAAVYHAYHGSKFIVPPGNLGFSVMVFCSEALVAIMILVVRRNKHVGGELGGPPCIKYITSAVLFSLWLIYLTLSTLEAYGVIGV